MTEYGFHHLPVVDDERPVGMLGLRQAARQARGRTGSVSGSDGDRDLRRTTAADDERANQGSTRTATSQRTLDSESQSVASRSPCSRFDVGIALPGTARRRRGDLVQVPDQEGPKRLK